MPVVSVTPPTKKSEANQSSSTSSSSSSAKQFFTRRVRSQSKTDSQSVTDKSLFSKFFPKRSKKNMAPLLTTTTKSMSLDTKSNRAPLTNQASLSTYETQSTIDEEEEIGNDDDDDDLEHRPTSTVSLSDDENNDHSNKQTISNTQSSNSSRNGSRTNSGNSKISATGSNMMTIPTSDSQYYASLASAPKGFSISYHKCMTKGNDNLRKQAALGRLQQQNKQPGASELMVGRVRPFSRITHLSIDFPSMP